MASIIKRGNTYTVRISYKYLDRYKTFTKGGFKTRKEAEKYAIIHEDSIKKSGTTEVETLKCNPNNNVTIVSYFKTWYETFKDPVIADSTRRNYHAAFVHIKQFFKNDKLRDVTRLRYQQFLNWYGKEHARVSVVKIHYYIGSMVKSAIYDGIIASNFTKGISIPSNNKKEIKFNYLNLTETKRVINHLINYNNKKYTSRFMILTAFLTGMRLGEIQALTWEDIDFVNHTIDINKSYDSRKNVFKPTKTKSSVRNIVVPDILLEQLAKLKVNNKELVFMNCLNTVPSTSSVNKVLRRILDEELHIDRKPYVFHSIRHSFVALQYANDVDFYTISKHLGHKNPTTTINTYSYLMEEKKRKEEIKMIDKLNDLLD